MIVFKIHYDIERFIVYTSDDYDKLGDLSKIYVRRSCDLSEEDELVLISKKYFDALTAVIDYEEKED